MKVIFDALMSASVFFNSLQVSSIKSFETDSMSPRLSDGLRVLALRRRQRRSWRRPVDSSRSTAWDRDEELALDLNDAIHIYWKLN